MIFFFRLIKLDWCLLQLPCEDLEGGGVLVVGERTFSTTPLFATGAKSSPVSIFCFVFVVFFLLDYLVICTRFPREDCGVRRLALFLIDQCATPI